MDASFPQYPTGFGQQDVVCYGTTGRIVLDRRTQTVVKWPVDARSWRGILQEKRVYERLQELGSHPWLLKYYGGVEAYGLRLEYAAMTDLRSHIRYKGIGHSFEAMWMVQIAQALEFVHAAGIIHGSVMLSHVMLDAPGNAKLADFAWCCSFSSDTLLAQVLASHEYPGNRATVQGDLFALGSALYELKTGSEPFVEFRDEEIRARFRRGMFPDVLSMGTLGEIISRCWAGSYESATGPKDALEGNTRHHGPRMPGAGRIPAQGVPRVTHATEHEAERKGGREAAAARAEAQFDRMREHIALLPHTSGIMSVAYEPRSFIHEGAYPPIGDEHDHGADQRFTDSDVAEHLSHYTADAAGMLQDDRDVMDERSMLHNHSGGPDDDGTRLDLGAGDFPSPLEVPMSATDMSPALPDSKDPSPGLDSLSSSRIKPIPKPSRAVSKQADGRFHCPLDDCKEEIRAFLRKCEWNKHMDKHERPYRCPADGCENLPGFTYSGGLLRHEREVHNKHGGPKNTVNCPHPNCKRHTGKGFSRQENLNEHLRRVHTSPDGASPLGGNGGGTGADYSAAGSHTDDNDSERSGMKRKRRSSGGTASDEVAELRDEIKRVRMENEKLKADMEQQGQHSLAMMAQIAELQDALRHGLGSHGLGAPTAQMI